MGSCSSRSIVRVEQHIKDFEIEPRAAETVLKLLKTGLLSGSNQAQLDRVTLTVESVLLGRSKLISTGDIHVVQCLMAALGDIGLLCSPTLQVGYWCLCHAPPRPRHMT